jgi:uncharacterized membrane protein
VETEPNQITLAKPRAIPIMEGSIFLMMAELSCFFRSGYFVGVLVIVLLIYGMANKCRIFQEVFPMLTWWERCGAENKGDQRSDTH